MAKKSIPKLCRHSASGRGYVTDPFTHLEVYLGDHGTAACQAAYEAWVLQLLSRRAEVASGAPPGSRVSVARLVGDFQAHAEQWYRKHDEPTSEANSFRTVGLIAVELFGTLPANDFGPAQLKAARQVMVGRGWARGHINAMVGRLRRVWRWGVKEELVRAETLTALEAVDPLAKGRAGIREERPVPPVSLELLWATVFHADSRLGRLIRLQLYGGMRVEEVVVLRGRDIDQVSWVFQPWSWKTEHRNRPRRRIWLGSKAREILEPMLAAAGQDVWLFPARTRFGFVNPSKYGHDLERCCRRHGLPHWYPSQIRHTALTLVREAYGLEAAQAVGGHARADVTQIYAERDERLARRAAEEMWADAPEKKQR